MSKLYGNISNMIKEKMRGNIVLDDGSHVNKKMLVVFAIACFIAGIVVPCLI